MNIKRILVCLIAYMMVASAVPLLIGPAGADGTTSRAPDTNTDFASAVTIIGDDVPYSSELTGLDDTLDYFKIELNNTGSGAQKLIVNATASGNGAVKLNVYDPNTYWIATDLTLGLTSYLEVIVEWSGWYYVSIEGQGQTFTYNMRFQKVSVPWSGDSNTDAANATVVGSFPYEVTDVTYDNVTDPQDFYKVHLENVPGDHVDILMVKVTPPDAAETLVILVFQSSEATRVLPHWLREPVNWTNYPIKAIRQPPPCEKTSVGHPTCFLTPQ